MFLKLIPIHVLYSYFLHLSQQTCFTELQNPTSTTDKLTILRHLGKLLRLALDLLRAQSSMHFTALSLINRVIDICILHNAHHPWTLQNTDAQNQVMVHIYRTWNIYNNLTSPFINMLTQSSNIYGHCRTQTLKIR